MPKTVLCPCHTASPKFLCPQTGERWRLKAEKEGKVWLAATTAPVAICVCIRKWDQPGLGWLLASGPKRKAVCRELR